MPPQHLSAAPSDSRPDVLFVIFDDLNDWTQLFDPENPIQTPNLERLAKRGMFFTNAHTVAPACGPSRSALWSGRAPYQSGAYENAPKVYRKAMPDDVSMPDWFRRNGYVSVGAGKIFHNGGGNDSMDKSFDRFTKLGANPKAKSSGLKLPTWADFGEVDGPLADKVSTDAMVAYLGENPDQPRFAAHGIYAPHLPHYAHPEQFALYPRDAVIMPVMPKNDFDDIPEPGVVMAHRELFRLEKNLEQPSGSQGSLDHLVQSYQAAATHADARLGEVLDALDASARADRTIIVCTSDHGYHLGDKESISKFTLWEKATRVPLLIVAPGVTTPGSRSDEPVSLIDLFPTLTELAGLPEKPGIDGESLVPILRDPGASRDRPALTTMGRGNHSLRNREWRYIRYHDGSEELYHANDPWNVTNLAGDEQAAAVIRQFRSQLPKREVPVPDFFGNSYKAPGYDADKAPKNQRPAPKPKAKSMTNAAAAKSVPSPRQPQSGFDRHSKPDISRGHPVTPELHLDYHLMHPGKSAGPADPNAALYVDGKYHLHYIYNRKGKRGDFAFAHVTSPDMVHWDWQPTNLDPDNRGHGMFSGTAFFTKEGEPAIIYHGQKANLNQLAIAKNRELTEWHPSQAVEPENPKGLDVSNVINWDPDCFRIGDTYYAMFGNRIGMVEQVPYLAKSTDLENWSYVGPFLTHEMPNVLTVEDVSCANFFPIGNQGKWMLLCISHNLGCRYYIGEWDATREQFVPDSHGRMSWPLEWHGIDERSRLNLFAPESVLTPDGRRVMWGWLFELPGGVQSLPRELDLPADNILRIRPARELEALRTEEKILTDVPVPSSSDRKGEMYHHVADLPGEAVEIRAVFDRDQAEHARLGFNLFADQADGSGFPILVQANSGMLRVGASEAPFAVTDLPPGEDLDIRIFIDKYLVEVFVNDRQALIGWVDDWQGWNKLHAYSELKPIEIKELSIWKLKPANAGFKKALQSGIVE